MVGEELQKCLLMQSNKKCKVKRRCEIRQMCARGLHMCGFSSHIFCWEDRAALTGIIFLEGLLGFAPHCLAVLLEPEVTSLLPAWGEDLQEVSPLQEKLEVGITLQTWGSREQKTTLEKLQEKCKRSEITSRPSLESHGFANTRAHKRFYAVTTT